MLFSGIGEDGQAMLRRSAVTLIGCGALGTVIANTLVRAGVGRLRIVDRDYVEWNNLQRQVLFDEQDAREGRPKAVAAAEALARINAEVEIEAVVADAHSNNMASFASGAGVLLDGTDNFETRYLINDAAIKFGIPWVYGACVAAEGMVMPVVPHETPCLRCIFHAPPPPGVSPTCDTAGVIAPIVQIVASRQVVTAMKMLTGRFRPEECRLTQIDAWSGEVSAFDMSKARDGSCPCCGQRRFEFLDEGANGRVAALCGRDAVQVRPASDTTVDLAALAERIGPVAKQPPTVNRYLLRFEVEAYGLTVFRDGRAIIKGATSADEGKTIYAKYIGN